MASENISACLAVSLRWEGGWADVAADPGGPTMKGITIGVYAGFTGETVRRDARGKHIRDAHFEALKARLRNITDAEVLEIYRRNYWVLVRGDELPRGVDLAVFDFCLNAGPGQAVRSLQRVLGVNIDGHLGPATMGAVMRCDPGALIRVYMAERRRFYRALSTFPTFGKGWLRRADGVEAAAIEMAGPVTLENVAAIVTAPGPLPDKDGQASSQGKATAAAPTPPKATETTLSVGGVSFNIAGFANFFSKLGAMTAPTARDVLYALLAEPLILAGVVMTFAALTTWLWRRRQEAMA